MKWRLGVLLVLLGLAATTVAAQGTNAVVAGIGTETVQVLPDELRMAVGLRVQRDTLEEALEVYRTRRDAVTKLLKEAGALEDSVKVSDPKLGTAGGRAEMMRRMMGMGSRQERGEAEETGKIISFTAEATWQLSATSVEELLLESATAEKKVGGLDLLGKETMTPEELEALEEAAFSEEDDFTGRGRATPPGKPTFAYAKKLDPVQVTEMKKKAYQQAVKTAEELAALADKGLGDLVTLAVTVTPGSTEDGGRYEIGRAHV